MIFIDEPDFLEFTSFINLRPSLNNQSMDIQSSELRNSIRNIVNKLLIKE